MDIDRFDHLTRLLAEAPSRRAVMGSALGGLLGLLERGDTIAKKKKRKKCPPCKKRNKHGKCKPQPSGTPCGGGKVCQGGACRCRTTCTDAGDCCDGQDCLSNSSCAKLCTQSADCAPGCDCEFVSTEGATLCVENLSCQEAAQCVNITGCLAGDACMVTQCSVGPNRCLPLCVT